MLMRLKARPARQATDEAERRGAEMQRGAEFEQAVAENTLFLQRYLEVQNRVSTL